MAYLCHSVLWGQGQSVLNAHPRRQRAPGEVVPGTPDKEELLQQKLGGGGG